MAQKQIHTVRTSGGWGNRRNGASRPPKIFPTKAEAVKAGRATAKRQRAEYVIHKRDGQIGSSNSYGNDPFPPRG